MSPLKTNRPQPCGLRDFGFTYATVKSRSTKITGDHEGPEDVCHRGTESQRRVGGRRPACNAGRHARSDRIGARADTTSTIGSCADPSPAARVPLSLRDASTRSTRSRSADGKLRASASSESCSLCLCDSVATFTSFLRDSHASLKTRDECKLPGARVDMPASGTSADYAHRLAGVAGIMSASPLSRFNVTRVVVSCPCAFTVGGNLRWISVPEISNGRFSVLPFPGPSVAS